MVLAKPQRPLMASIARAVLVVLMTEASLRELRKRLDDRLLMIKEKPDFESGFFYPIGELIEQHGMRNVYRIRVHAHILRKTPTTLPMTIVSRKSLAFT